ncbi:hypothetical protein Bbelb_054500 [Branchiostoma belcheri]|nr:hypothetical protein Bbelb_054500 [Branchiostoma belcheri]
MGGLGGNVTVQRKFEPRMTLTRVREEGSEERQHDREGKDDDESYLDKVSTRLHKERPIELHVRLRGGRNFVVELTFTHTWEPVELHVRLSEKPDAHGTLVNSSSPARGVELRWDLRSPARGVELRWDLRSPARGVELPMTWGRGVKAKWGRKNGVGGIEQGGVGTEEEDVPRNMLCQTGVCE